MKYKVPMYFIYGGSDKTADNFARNVESTIKGGRKLELTGRRAITGTKLSGSQLLQKSLDTQKYIIEYLDKVMDGRGSRLAKKRDVENSGYVWEIPAQFPGGRPSYIQAKVAMAEDMLHPVPLQYFG